ncbi:MAG TPA: ATP-binding cassette domain-containing protein [Candidatus Avipropionibacterium avicola]|uniref:ATP-binding cassette domain-containing protein n=1 Tax=Candidatus Avipropionibacterium avicola TaxID=2840701 RepID=A0A9D1GV98_9ACTN|nr:ATP-binding cassette domain-containing protein [Candidatus Avipropionibacterium avicola]
MSVAVRLRDFGWRPLRRRRPVLSGLDLTIEQGERVGVVGPSGAGKSSLLHAIAGILGATVPGHLDGSVETSGRVGMVLQDPAAAVVADRIGRDVAFGPENVGLAREQIWARVHESLDRVGLTQGPDHPTSALSGGERQRLALAGALALDPAILLLDEATSMLQSDQAEQVRRAVGECVADRRTTLVVVDHHIGPWLGELDRIVVLAEDGSTIELDDPGRLVADHGERLTAAGIWLPGIPAPPPSRIHDDLVAPDGPGPSLAVRQLGVELTSRRIRGTTTTVAVDRLDLDLASASLTALTGASGVGKSTVLAVLAGLQTPTRGTISGLDRSLHTERSPHTERSLHTLGSLDLARQVGWVPQTAEHGFLTSRVRDEIEFTSARLGRHVDTDQVLEVLRLSHLAEANPYRLSGGEQRRLALAAALAHRPGLIAADEPTVGQDRHTWAAVTGWLRGAADSGATVAIASHDPAVIDTADARVALTGRFG